MVYRLESCLPTGSKNMLVLRERSLSQIVMMVVNASAPAKQDVQLITSKQATVQKANYPLPSLCVLVKDCLIPLR